MHDRASALQTSLSLRTSVCLPIVIVLAVVTAACGGSARRRVTDGGVPDGAGSGGLVIRAELDPCADLVTTQIAPLEVSVGGTIHVKATPVQSGRSMSFGWKASAGVFANPTAPSTTYECAVAGSHTLTLEVESGTCKTSVTAPVTCLGVRCGNRVIEPGETCDDGNSLTGDGCSASCQVESACAAPAPPVPSLCDPEIPVSGITDIMIRLPAVWPFDDPSVSRVLPVSPNLRAAADLALRPGDLAAQACPSGLSCLPVVFEKAPGLRTAEGIFLDKGELRIARGVRFRVAARRAEVVPGHLGQRLVFYPPCDQPCAAGEIRCPHDRICYDEASFCDRCMALGAACCACATSTGARADGQPCEYATSPTVRRSGRCLRGVCGM